MRFRHASKTRPVWDRNRSFCLPSSGSVRLVQILKVVVLCLGLTAACPPLVLAESQPLWTDTNAVDPAELARKFGVGTWIWAAHTHNQQLCRFWRSIEIPAGSKVVNAEFRITADNSYSLFLDGRELGRGADWRDLTEYDLTLLLHPGVHTLAVEAFNVTSEAGVLAGLHIDLADGRTIDLVSDTNWKVVPNTETRWERRTRPREDWPAATVVALRGVREHWNLRIVKTPQLYPIILRFWQTGWFQITVFSLFVLLIALCAWLIGKVVLQSRTQQVLRRERARIARDIHDDFSAGLTQLVLFGEVAQRLLPEDSESRREASRYCAKARDLVHAMHDIIWAIDSGHDTMGDFTSHVCKFAEIFLQPTTILCRFDLDEEIPDFPLDLGARRNMFLAIKEAIHNVVRHSGASELILRIHRSESDIVVVIEDNGGGFEWGGRQRECRGISNMIKRASEAGGRCAIESRPGAGCRVMLAIPITRPPRNPVGWLKRFWNRPRSFRLRPVAASSTVGIAKSIS